jgi:DNA repair protein RecN (Recombination protein N)
MERAVGLDERLSPTLTQIRDAYHQLDDAAEFLRRHLDQFVYDPVRLEEVEDRLALLNRLKRKYGPSLDDVMNYERQAAGQLDRIEDMTGRLADLNADIEAAEEKARQIADKTSASRRKKADKMSALVAEQLRELGMPHLEFGIAFQPPADDRNPGPLGWDEIEFMISPNLGEELKPLSKIASGGELSRTVLGIKSILAGQDKVQTIIFDEVDAGIGGAVAEVVGRKIKELAAHHQLLCITHLPQIAAFGRHHHHVFKEVRGNRTVTGIRPLSPNEKVEEIAGMLGGVESSNKARAAAKELIARAESL